jgi:hypothetical protein
MKVLKFLLVFLLVLVAVLPITGCESNGNYGNSNSDYYDTYQGYAPIRVDIENLSGYTCGVFKGDAQYALYKPGDKLPMYDDEVFNGQSIVIKVWWLEDQGGQLVKVHEQSVTVDNSYKVYKLVISNSQFNLYNGD